ncbi:MULTISPECIES: DMT family transporter [unclassified Motilimonas]|uniref:DMT family transporter n=1 Tax=Motilimonas TaxID=1914248 RepID=UPI001E648E2E|nr:MULTISPECIES: DMT family transporter [unclassified Motilimonas]MCE0557115.1 DMT family transporter [Motilimonas sp. E26]MDO6524350.1 DMT family transporter [Motilimonas sp. 1_MG-2023]
MPSSIQIKFLLQLLLTLTLFAANSIFCRFALASGEIAAAEFTVLRLISGAFTLWGLSFLFASLGKEQASGSWGGAVALLFYAAGFSFAYVQLDAGVGALILFALVQLTLFLINFRQGYIANLFELAGMLLAMVGLAYLLLPSSSAPSLSAALLMALAGIAWGVYTWLGKGVKHPVVMTRQNFSRAALLSLSLLPWFNWTEMLSINGMVLACLSGGLASGLGYTLWYLLLPSIPAAQAGLYQLSVPIITAILGIVLLDESWTLPLTISSLLVIGGIAIAMLKRGTD